MIAPQRERTNNRQRNKCKDFHWGAPAFAHTQYCLTCKHQSDSKDNAGSVARKSCEFECDQPYSPSSSSSSSIPLGSSSSNPAFSGHFEYSVALEQKTLCNLPFFVYKCDTYKRLVKNSDGYRQLIACHLAFEQHLPPPDYKIKIVTNKQKDFLNSADAKHGLIERLLGLVRDCVGFCKI